MTGIYIFNDPSEEKQTRTEREQHTLTGYPLLDDFFCRAIGRARMRNVEMELDVNLPEPLPIGEQDVVRILDEMLDSITKMTELASDDDLWARLIIQEEGKSMRMECHTTDDIEHDTSFIANFVGLVFQLDGSANLDGNGEIQVLWAEFPLLENTKFPKQRKTLL